MNYYIDLENVQASGLRGAGQLNKNDTVYVFYSANAKPRIPFETAQELTFSKGSFVFKEVVKLGKNAMDKEIIKKVEKDVKKGKSCYIISKDKGYRKFFKDNKDVLYKDMIK